MAKSADWKEAHLGYRFLVATLGPTARLASRLQARGVEHVPRAGPLLVASNHGSWSDPVLLGAILPRPLYFLGKDTAFRNPIVGGAFRAMGQIPVDRARRGNVDAVDAALHLLHDGKVVAIFPEATRSRPREVRQGHTGIARLAALSGAPVLPVGLDTGDFWPKHAKLPHLGARAYVNVGAPLALGLAPGDADDKARMRAATDDIMARVKELLDAAVDAREAGVKWR